MEPGARSQTMKRSNNDVVATAHHEAGHALADFKLGFRIKSVTIVPGDGYIGRITGHIGIHLGAAEVRNVTSATLARWHDKVVSLLAGGQAQRRFDPRSFRHWHTRDDKAAVDMLLSRHHEGDEGRALYRYLDIRARNLVAKPMNWRMIQDLARMLLVRRTMTGEQVVAEFRASLDRQMQEAQKSPRPRKS